MSERRGAIIHQWMGLGAILGSIIFSVVWWWQEITAQLWVWWHSAYDSLRANLLSTDVPDEILWATIGAGMCLMVWGHRREEAIIQKIEAKEEAEKEKALRNMVIEESIEHFCKVTGLDREQAWQRAMGIALVMMNDYPHDKDHLRFKHNLQKAAHQYNDQKREDMLRRTGLFSNKTQKRHS